MTAAKKRVLIAEDEPGYLDLFQVAVRGLGHEVYAVDNGRKALEIARKLPIDLLISDVMMPELDGYHLARAVSTELGERAPKILLLTSRETSKEKGLALLAGAAEFLQKPVSMDLFVERVSALLA